MEERSERAASTWEEGRVRRKYLWLILAAFLFAFMFYFMFAYPRKSLGPQQPIYFSHRVHAGVKQIPCQFCHPYAARSQNAGLPSIEKCFFCHQYIIPQHPQIVKERDHFNRKKPVPWIRIFFTPDYVFFRHLPHVGWHKLDCTNCHGDVKSMDRLVPIDFKMGFCIDCHRKMAPPDSETGVIGPPIAMLDCWLACHR